MSAEAYREYLRLKKLGRGKNKYNAKRTEIRGEAVGFPSRGEADAFQYFKKLEAIGVISALRRYPTVRLTAAEISYKPDWEYLDVGTGERRMVDFKGVETERFRLIKRLWKHYAEHPLEVWRGNPPQLSETIKPK